MVRMDLFLSRTARRNTGWITVAALISSLFLLFHIRRLTERLHEMEESQRSSFSDLKKEEKYKIINKIELDKVYKHYESTGQLKSLNPLSLNNTRLAESEILIFNRVPKVGSVMFMHLMAMLGKRNNFTGFKDLQQQVAHTYLDNESQKKMAEVLSELPQPSTYSKHLCYTNFTRFNLPRPIYINMVRSPVERIISWYYYLRAPWYFIQRKQTFPETPLPDIDWISRDYETCVLEQIHECSYIEGDLVMGDHRRQSLFMCGHDEDCRPFNTKEAIDLAKFSVETEYSVVGILEDFETSLAVFEKYIPRFFAGASEVYNKNKEYFKKINKNSFKPPVSDEIKNLVKKNFSQEIEFYEFCKKRLYTQFIAANLKNNN